MGRGRPQKELGLSQSQRDWIIKRVTLRRQVGKSLFTRTQIVNDRFGTNLKPSDLRKIYKEEKITSTCIKSMAAPNKFKSYEEQELELNQMKQEFFGYMAGKYHMIQYDACIFSASGYQKKQWAPLGKPLLAKQKYVTAALVCVFGFISVDVGGILFHIAEQ